MVDVYYKDVCERMLCVRQTEEIVCDNVRVCCVCVCVCEDACVRVFVL